MAKISVNWRSKQLNVEVNPRCTVKEFGQMLLELTNVKPETMKLIIPQSTNKSSKLIVPFSDAHSSLKLQVAAIIEGKSIRMMGVFDDEIKEVSENGTRPDLRIIGFDEEEKRMKQRMLGRPQFSLKLPRGTYIFCEFQTFHIPGIELNPPPSEALKRMHMLACDPGIIAIMNKHRWRVGIMTEMAPVGYVGVSPKCILGFNKNQGEEISLRLRTDDLKGFRKYESIKKTLLHELAHMVHSEHDANFFALNKQLNEEAASLDWTKSTGHVLGGHKIFDSYEEEFSLEPSNNIAGHKLGGVSNSLASVRALSGAAAYQRFLNASTNDSEGFQNSSHPFVKEDLMPGAETEPDPDDADQGVIQGKVQMEPDPDENDFMHVVVVRDSSKTLSDSRTLKEQSECSPVDFLEPDPDDAGAGDAMVTHGEPDPDDAGADDAMVTHGEPDPNDAGADDAMVTHGEPDPDDAGDAMVIHDEPDPDGIIVGDAMVTLDEPDPNDAGVSVAMVTHDEPDPDDHLAGKNTVSVKERQSCNIDHVQQNSEPDPDDSATIEVLNHAPAMHEKNCKEPVPDDCGRAVVLESGNKMAAVTQHIGDTVLKSEPDPDDHVDYLGSNELQRIEEPVAVHCARLQKAIETLRSEVAPAEAATALQTLFKIIRNVIEHPNDAKYKRLRKANPQFQRNVANYKAAMEVLETIGFCEDLVSDGIGRAETYMVLKRNDPGLLWLAKSSLEVSMA